MFIASALFSFSIIAVYIITFLFDTSSINDFSIPLVSLVFSIFSFALSSILIFNKNEKFSKLFSAIDYLVLLTNFGLLVYFTGKIGSPFIGVISILGIVSAIYGSYGVITLLAVIGSLVAGEYLDNNLSFKTISTAIVVCILPMILSIYIWHIKKNNNQNQPSAAENKSKKLTAQLEGISNQSETIIQAIGDGVMLIDNRGSVSMMNPAAESLTGWPFSDASRLNYKSIFQLLDEKGQQVTEENDPIAKALNNNEQIINDDLALQTKNNKKIMVSLHISPAGESGSGVIVVFRDITKAKAEESEQAEFISTASHEMRTPVASIEGYIGLALNSETATIDDRARAFITKAQESLQHLGRLFQDLLDVSRADDNRINYIPKVTNIMDLVEDIVNGLKAKAYEKQLQLIFQPKPDDSGRYVVPVYFVNLDPDLIREVVGNLVENAIKYSSIGNINVDVTATDENIVISVEDNGIGISEEDIPHLFQKFYRVNNPETNQIGGTGLGLYLSRKLVERLGGQISVKSQYHKGSTFTVQLPRITNEEAKALMQVQKNEITTIDKNADTPKLQDVLPPRPTYPSKETEKFIGSMNLDKMVKPATEVPRGESLSKEQILEKARQLHEMAQSQARPGAEISSSNQVKPSFVVNSRVANVRIPTRKEN